MPAMPTERLRLRVMRAFGSTLAQSVALREAPDWLRGAAAVIAGVIGVAGRLSPPLAVPFAPTLPFLPGAGVAAPT